MIGLSRVVIARIENGSYLTPEPWDGVISIPVDHGVEYSKRFVDGIVNGIARSISPLSGTATFYTNPFDNAMADTFEAGIHFVESTLEGDVLHILPKVRFSRSSQTMSHNTPHEVAYDMVGSWDDWEFVYTPHIRVDDPWGMQGLWELLYGTAEEGPSFPTAERLFHWDLNPPTDESEDPEEPNDPLEVFDVNVPHTVVYTDPESGYWSVDELPPDTADVEYGYWAWLSGMDAPGFVTSETLGGLGYLPWVFGVASGDVSWPTRSGITIAIRSKTARTLVYNDLFDVPQEGTEVGVRVIIP